ncbi:MAG: Holliday junction branch migration protein RuvA [Azospirillaceae bacterium]|nr:Holliday junction branch migration protein RuvA [Azospirillaceae bacterium]
MIAKLTGILDATGLDWAVIDVGGVGYRVSCSSRTLSRLGAPGAAVSVAVEMSVREDRIQLYGFADPAEREWFRLLNTVQGVGAKVALSILSVLEPDRLALAIAAQDKTALAAADGVGPRLANRLVSELKDKVGSLGPASPALAGAAAVTLPEGSGATADAVSALVNLGYRRVEAFTAVSAAARRLGEGAAVGDLIRQGLKELGS